ncbi:metal-dependent transcriptional regulator [Homoserinibacter sp. YIM 151385]|uniref:metal-dependent transcriptional regulator n=1 Tax=Homoserinibacter sp. YIM 151385 TaxID=2985506 RepID=UPI0022F0FEA0|nr:metal-dependent transcriptional regulator [Homoserinibacter sp. YIM 151385]WBU38182.1 metal-dependent transcriptional regulator [Homoserinibacter sp. YIM 151385]
MRNARSTPIASAAPRRPASSVVEDYLKAVYTHQEWRGTPVSSSQLATRLGLAPSTVTEMVKKLVAMELVRHAPYGAITLTPEGEREALRILRRHRLVETWLVERCGYGWDEVDDEAEILEHAMSDRLLEELAEQLGQPARDPHGDPIPSRDGVIVRPDGILLADAARGYRGRIVRIDDADADVLRRLAAAGAGLDSVVVAGQLDAQVEGAVWIAPPSAR